MKLLLSVSILAFLSAVAHGFPQSEQSSLSANDVVKSAESSSRYGQNSGEVDQGILADVFGTGPNSNSNEQQDNNNVGPPGGYIEDDQYDNCTFYKESGFECVPYYQCKDGYIITDGAGLFDIRNGFSDVLDPANSKCESYLEVCCRDENFSGVPLPKKPVTTTTTTTTEAPKTVAPLQQCGSRNTGGVDVRIQNDQYTGSTQFGEWPHMCAVLRKGELGGNDVNLYACGASLIAPGVVLTAAHCVKDFVEDPSVLKVRCGEWDTQQVIEPRRHEDRIAYDISIHPLFNPRNLQNNVALIHLDGEFVLQPHINTICLPDQHYDDFFSNECFATGWGKDKFGKEGEYQVIMKQVKMDLVEHSECQDILRTTRLGKRFRLDESFLCAGGIPGKDTCKGDGGGPLVCPRYNNVNTYGQQYVQTGIVAWGIGCGSEIPGVYANVSDSLCFIDWATKCVHGQDADFYGYNGCNRWAKRQYCSYKDELIRLQSGDQSNPDTLLNLRKMDDLTRRFEKSVSTCKSAPDYGLPIDCSHYDSLTDSDNIDLSGNARDGAVPKSSDKAFDNDEDDEEAVEDESGPRFGLDSK
jgi:secreted trypsin-like serine protease